MNRYFYLLLLGAIIFSCSPKVGNQVTEKTSEVEPENLSTEWRANAPDPGPAPEFNLGDYEQFTLENDLNIIVVENHKLPVVSYQLFVDKGAIVEGDKTGLASVAGQMLKRGTESKTKSEIDEALDFIAASVNTNSSGFYATSLKKHSEELLEIATDLLYNPSFPQEEFDKIIQTTKSGLAFSKSDPNTIASNVKGAVLYGKDHAYGEFVMEETIDNITLEDVKDYYRKYYFPNESYLIIVGDITSSDALDQAKKYFGDWKADPTFKKHIPPFVERPESNTVNFVNKDGAVQSVLSVSQTARYKPNAEDRLAASVMNTILGGYFGSRLNKNIREDKGYTYGIGSSLSPDLHIGSFSTSASVRNAVTDSTLTEIFREIETMRTEPVDQDELELVKNVLTGKYARGLESPQTVAQYALNIARYDLPKDYYKTYLERLEKLTPEDIQMAAKKYLDPEKMQILVVGNEDEVASKLIPFDGNGEIDFYDVKANKIDKSVSENTDDESNDISAEEVVDKYLEAIGGKEKIKQVNGMFIKSVAETPMGNVTTTIKTADNSKLNMTVEAQGMTVQEIVFNGLKAKMGGMQGSQVIDDPKEFGRFRNMAKFAPELDYFSSGDYNVEMKGSEKLDGTDVYKIVVKTIDGSTLTEYYNKETGLKEKVVSNAEVNGQQISTEQVFEEYKEVKGFLIPHSVTFSGGGMPFEMVQKVEEIEINPEITNDDFKVE